MKDGFGDFYHIGRYSFLWNCIVHHYCTNPLSKTFFLINLSGISDGAVTFLKKLQSNASEDIEIVFYKEGYFFNTPINGLEDRIDNYFDKICKDNGIDLSKWNFYSSFDKHNAFAVYLIRNNRKYNLFDLNGRSLKTVSMKSYPSKLKDYVDLMVSYGALNVNKSVKKVISLSKGEYAYSIDNEFFDCNEGLKGLSDSVKDRVYSYFSVCDYNITKDENLLLTSSIWVGSFDDDPIEYYRTYGAIADYYLSDLPVVLKPHPAADTSQWSIFFDKIVPPAIPSQFLNDSGGMNPNFMIYTGTSGGDVDCNSVNLSTDYLCSYLINDKLYHIIKHIKEFYSASFETNIKNLDFIKECESLVSSPSTCRESVKVTLVNSPLNIKKLLDNQRDDEIIIDINSHNYSLLYYSPTYKACSLIMNLTIINRRDDHLKTHGGHIIMYFKNLAHLSMLSTYSISTHNDHCNEDVSYYPEDYQIALFNLIKNDDYSIPSRFYDKLFNKIHNRVLHNMVLYHNCQYEERYALIEAILRKDPFNDLYAPICSLDPHYSNYLVYLGNAYRDGTKGHKKDSHKAIECYTNAISLGNKYAALELFDLLWEDRNDDSKMIDCISQLVESEDLDALARLGKSYAYGRGVPKDLEKAKELLTPAANNGLKWAIELFSSLGSSNYE